MLRKFLCLLAFLPIGCFAEQYVSKKPVYLKLTDAAVYWKENYLDFNQTAEEWVRVLDAPYVFGDELPQVRLARFSNRRIIFPSLGIDIKVASDIPYHEGSVIPDPMKRPIEVVRVYINPTNTATDLLKFYSDKVKQHIHHRMSYPYAIDFYGALVDRHTSKQQILDSAKGAASSRHFNSVDVWRTDIIQVNGSISFNDFFGNKPQVSYMLEIWPSDTWRRRNNIEYFGYPEQQPRKTQ